MGFRKKFHPPRLFFLLCCLCLNIYAQLNRNLPPNRHHQKGTVWIVEIYRKSKKKNVITSYFPPPNESKIDEDGGRRNSTKEKKFNTNTFARCAASFGKAEESESFFAYFTSNGSTTSSLKQYHARNIMRWNNNLISNRQFSMEFSKTTELCNSEWFSPSVEQFRWPRWAHRMRQKCYTAVTKAQARWNGGLYRKSDENSSESWTDFEFLTPRWTRNFEKLALSEESSDSFTWIQTFDQKLKFNLSRIWVNPRMIHHSKGVWRSHHNRFRTEASNYFEVQESLIFEESQSFICHDKTLTSCRVPLGSWVKSQSLSRQKLREIAKFHSPSWWRFPKTWSLHDFTVAASSKSLRDFTQTQPKHRKFRDWISDPGPHESSKSRPSQTKDEKKVLLLLFPLTQKLNRFRHFLLFNFFNLHRRKMSRNILFAFGKKTCLTAFKVFFPLRSLNTIFGRQNSVFFSSIATATKRFFFLFFNFDEEKVFLSLTRCASISS